MSRPHLVAAPIALLSVILAGCFGESRDQQVDVFGSNPPSSGPGFHAGSCRVNPTIQINELRSRARSYVGGNLAANVNAAQYPVRSVDKSIWALRTGTPPAQLHLIRERLDVPTRAEDIIGHRIEHGDDSALPEWGPTYYLELRFPSAGCWRLRLRDGQPEDFIVFRVIES